MRTLLSILVTLVLAGCAPGFLGKPFLPKPKRVVVSETVQRSPQLSNQPRYPDANTGRKIRAYYQDMIQVRDSLQTILTTDIGKRRLQILLEKWCEQPDSTEIASHSIPDSTVKKAIWQGNNLPLILNRLRSERVWHDIQRYQEAVKNYQSAVNKARSTFVLDTLPFMFLRRDATIAGADQEIAMHLQNLALFAVAYEAFYDGLHQVYRRLTDQDQLNAVHMKEITQGGNVQDVEPFATLEWPEFFQQSLEDLSRMNFELPINREGD